MKTKLILLFALLAIFCSNLFGQADVPIVLDSQYPSLAPLRVKVGEGVTYRIYYQDGGTPTDITGRGPWMGWATNVNATSGWWAANITIFNATAGIARASFSSNLFWTNGTFLYGAGLTVGPRVYQQSTLYIDKSPFTVSVPFPPTATTNINCDLYTWLDAPWDVLNAAMLGLFNSSSNALHGVDVDLQGQIMAWLALMQSGSNALAGAVANEATQRVSGVSGVSNYVTGVSNALAGVDSNLQSQITAEVNSAAHTNTSPAFISVTSTPDGGNNSIQSGMFNGCPAIIVHHGGSDWSMLLYTNYQWRFCDWPSASGLAKVQAVITNAGDVAGYNTNMTVTGIQNMPVILPALTTNVDGYAIKYSSESNCWTLGPAASTGGGTSNATCWAHGPFAVWHSGTLAGSYATWALASVVASNGDVVYVAPGSFSIHPVTYPQASGVKFVGCGPGVTTLSLQFYFYMLNKTNSFAEMTLDGTEGNTFCFNLGGSASLTLDHCVLLSPTYAVYSAQMSSSNDIHASFCRFLASIGRSNNSVTNVLWTDNSTYAPGVTVTFAATNIRDYAYAFAVSANTNADTKTPLAMFSLTNNSVQAQIKTNSDAIAAAGGGTTISNLVSIFGTNKATSVTSTNVGFYRSIRPGYLPSTVCNVGGYECTYTDLGGLTIASGSLNLLNAALNVDPQANDGSLANPSYSWAAETSRGKSRMSYAGDYAELYGAHGTGTWYWANDGIHTTNGAAYFYGKTNLITLITNMMAQIVRLTNQLSLANACILDLSNNAAMLDGENHFTSGTNYFNAMSATNVVIANLAHSPFGQIRAQVYDGTTFSIQGRDDNIIMTLPYQLSSPAVLRFSSNALVNARLSQGYGLPANTCFASGTISNQFLSGKTYTLTVADVNGITNAISFTNGPAMSITTNGVQTP